MARGRRAYNGPSQEVIEDARAFGAPAEVLSALAAEAPNEEGFFAIWPANHEAVRLFASMGTQWESIAFAGFSGGAVIRTGLDYSALKAAGEMSGVDWPNPGLLRDVQVMESAALAVWNKK